MSAVTTNSTFSFPVFKNVNLCENFFLISTDLQFYKLSSPLIANFARFFRFCDLYNMKKLFVNDSFTTCWLLFKTSNLLAIRGRRWFIALRIVYFINFYNFIYRNIFTKKSRNLCKSWLLIGQNLTSKQNKNKSENFV